jgi:hypothetical protein
VLVEFGGRNATEPNEEYSLRPYIAEKIKELEFPSAKVRVLLPVRNFWEKTTLIHVEWYRPEPWMEADRLSRHWSDLAALADQQPFIQNADFCTFLARYTPAKRMAPAPHSGCKEGSGFLGKARGF